MKNNIWKVASLTIGAGILALWLTCWPLQSQALAWKTKEKVCNTLCREEAEFWLTVKGLSNIEYVKWQEVWVVKKVCYWDEELDWEWWWYVMVSEKFDPKIHWKLEVFECESEIYWWNNPEAKKWKNITILLADKNHILPWTDNFYKINFENWLEGLKILEWISAGLRTK